MPSSLAKRDTAPLLKRPTLDAEAVLRAFFARRSPRTVEAYRGDLELFRAWLVDRGEELLDTAALTTWLFAQGPGPLNALLLEWQDEQLAAGRAPFTVNRRLSALRSLVKLGRTLGLINWALDVQGVRGARGVRDMRGPTELGVQVLFTKTTDALGRCLLHLLYTRGLRSVEVRELKLEHLLLDRSEVLIRGKGKTGLEPVTLAPETLQAVKDWLHVRGDAPGYLITLRNAAKPISRTSFWRLVKRAGQKAGVEVRPHGLRHSAITAVLDSTNGDVRRVQKFSRHANPAVLLHHYDDARKDFGGELSKQLGKKVR